MWKKSLLFLCCFLIFAAGRISAAYTIIENDGQFQPVFQQARALLASNFGISVNGPVRALLVDGAKLDALYSGAYRGNQIGLYRRAGGVHEIYVMGDRDRDQVLGTSAHELVHAWQSEACRPDQDIVVKEGFALWIEYKLMDRTGAYALANQIRNTADPVYGVGLKRMLDWEQQIGEKELIRRIRNVKTVEDTI